jgi:sialidase-1
MIDRQFLNGLLFLLLFFGSCGLSTANEASQVSDVEINYPSIPLLKRNTHNAILSVRFFVSDARPAGSIHGIELRIDKDAAENLDELVVYQNGREPLFDTTAAQIRSTPDMGTKTLRVSIPYQQGWNYVWIGASLRATANIDARPSVELVALVNSDKKPLAIAGITGHPKKRLGVAVRKAWEDRVHTYRIPGIVQTDKGTLISVYDNRYESTKDLPGNVDIGMSRSIDGGKTWQRMKVIMDMGPPHDNNGIGDPSVLFDPVTRTIWVAALWSKGNRSIAGSEPGLSPDQTGQLMLVSSTDDGLTWSPPYNITAQVKNPIWHIYFNGPGSGIVMEDGTLVFASQYWDESKKPGIPFSTIMYSKDRGKTWHSGTGFKSNTTEAQVVETTPGKLMLNMRDQRGYFRSVATTSDLGKTWQEHPTSFHALPDPICMGSIIKSRAVVKGAQKDVLFFSNINNSSVEHSRKDMTIKASMDYGETWPEENQLLLDERYGYGYSSLTRIDEKTIGILYEGLRELYFVRIPVSDLIK